MGGGGILQKRKKEKELMDMENSVVVVGDRDVSGGGRGYRWDKW